MIFINMGFNFNKYDGVSFHKDEMIHKKIKALLVWFDYKAQDLSLSYKEKIKLLDNIIKNMAEEEWYEVSKFFSNIKSDLIKKGR